MKLTHVLIFGVAMSFAGAALAEPADTPLTHHRVIVKTTKHTVVTRHVVTHVGYSEAQERRERAITADLNRHGVQVISPGDSDRDGRP